MMTEATKALVNKLADHIACWSDGTVDALPNTVRSVDMTNNDVVAITWHTGEVSVVKWTPGPNGELVSGPVYEPIAATNCTPHDIRLCRPDGTTLAILPASGMVARVSQDEGLREADLGCAPVFGASEYGAVEGMPVSGPCVVSLFAAQALKAMGGDTSRLLVPGTGPADGAIRKGGRIYGVTRFVRA